VSGAKSDTGDAHAPADMVRTNAHQLRPVVRDSPAPQAVKVVARAHKTLIWERTRHVQRAGSHTLRHLASHSPYMPKMIRPTAATIRANTPNGWSRRVFSAVSRPPALAAW
jgi:hypothetical protein